MDLVSIIVFIGLVVLIVGAFFLVSLLNQHSNKSINGYEDNQVDMIEQGIDSKIYSNPLIRDPNEVKRRRIEDEKKY